MDEHTIKNLPDITYKRVLKEYPWIIKNPTEDGNKAIRFASINGHLDIVKLLLADPQVNTHYINYITAITMAATYGHLEIVEFLLSDTPVDPSEFNNWSIKYASQRGHTEIVRLLLNDPRVDPSASNNESLRYASRNGYSEIVKLLLADPRVDPAANLTSFRELSKEFPSAFIISP